MSIRYHLILRLLLASLLLVGGVMYVGYEDIQHETSELFDAQLARSARLILSMVQSDTANIDFSSIQQYMEENQVHTTDSDSDATDHDEDEEELEAGHVYETKLGFQIWDELGNLILKSPNAPLTAFTDKPNGFSHTQALDSDWRVFSLTSLDKKYRCITAERVDVRNDLIGKISSDLFALFIILIPALSITTWFAINRGLAPLQNLTTQILNRDAKKLSALSVENAPAEIRTITDAINQLLSKLRQAFERERRISSDAAHELRTPLAAVKLHAQLAKAADKKEDRINSIDMVLLGIDRTTHLVDQLLALARLEPESFSEHLVELNLNHLVQDETAQLIPLAQTKDIEIAIEEDLQLNIIADDTALRLLVSNLLVNAISYTQQGGSIEVALTQRDDTACLVVKDNGPGIALADRERVLERFYRVKNHDTPGCGIGLSIVLRVTQLLNAQLIMEDSDPDNQQSPGLKVSVCFP